MQFRNKKPALLLIDVQKGLNNSYWGKRNNPQAEQVCQQLLAVWRELKLPVFHIRHSSSELSSPLHASKEGFAFNDLVLPKAHEPEIVKQVNSAFIGTNLQALLDQQKLNCLVIAGLTTNHCVSTSTRMAGNLGYETYLISDATAAYSRTGVDGQEFDAETIHQTSLANLHEEFATVWTSAQLMQAL